MGLLQFAIFTHHILQKKVEQMSQAFLFMAMFHQRLILRMSIAKRAIGSVISLSSGVYPSTFTSHLPQS